jgi:hypothetical protein
MESSWEVMKEGSLCLVAGGGSHKTRGTTPCTEATETYTKFLLRGHVPGYCLSNLGSVSPFIRVTTSAFQKSKQKCRLTPAIPATWEIEIGRIVVRGQPQKIVLETPISKITKAKWTGAGDQVVERLICKHEVPSSNPSADKKKKIAQVSGIKARMTKSSQRE